MKTPCDVRGKSASLALFNLKQRGSVAGVKPENPTSAERRKGAAYHNMARAVAALLAPGGATQAELQALLRDHQGAEVKSREVVYSILSALEEAGLTVLGRGPSQGAGKAPRMRLAVPAGVARDRHLSVSFTPGQSQIQIHAVLTARRDLTFLHADGLRAEYRATCDDLEAQMLSGFLTAMNVGFSLDILSPAVSNT